MCIGKNFARHRCMPTCKFFRYTNKHYCNYGSSTKLKLAKQYFRFGVVPMYLDVRGVRRERVSEVNLCMQHNEANAIIYKPVGDMDFARYSFCILSTAHTHTHFSITKKINLHIFRMYKKYHLKIAACTSHSPCRSYKRGATSRSWTAGELDFEYRDCHTEKNKSFHRSNT